MHDINSLFENFSSLKVGVIGDVMLDTYMWGDVDRVSPEAPVPIVSLKKKEHRVGGAGNVALNLKSLGAQTFVISVTGNDDEAKKLNELFSSAQIDARYSFKSDKRITTNKIRIIGRNQQMMRLDGEILDDLNTDDEKTLIASFEEFLNNEKPDVVIMQDYNKGVLTEKVIESVIAACTSHGVVTAVDPKRKNFFCYKNVDIFKPNFKEAKDALNYLHADVNNDTLSGIHRELYQRLHHKISFITLSEKGVFYQQDNRSDIIPSHIRNVADVSGAGDTVIAAAAVVYAVSRDLQLMAEIANMAGGLVCEQVGTVPVDKSRLEEKAEALLSGAKKTSKYSA